MTARKKDVAWVKGGVQEGVINALVVYDSQYRNTERIARAIATRLDAGGVVRLIAAADARTLDVTGIDLLMVGGPTQRHGVSQAVETFLDGIPRSMLHMHSLAEAVA